jgi:hypothetical protein
MAIEPQKALRERVRSTGLTMINGADMSTDRVHAFVTILGIAGAAITALTTLPVAASVSGALSGAAMPAPAIVTEDVDRFFAIYDAANGRPTAEQLQNYIDTGSSGLRHLAEARRVTGVRIAEAIAQRPEMYVEARNCATVLPRVRARLDAALREFARIYPEMRTPAVTIAVGRGRPVAIGGPENGVQVGLEALCAYDMLNANLEDRFVYVLAHEFVHAQQSTELIRREPPTVLQLSLAEGIAEFVGELIAGEVAYGNLRGAVAGREEEIETRFLADRDSTDLSAWLYNASADSPGDFGYWVGYRIAKAYYRNAPDKRRAVREILEMADPAAFLEASGWYPGIEL